MKYVSTRGHMDEKTFTEVLVMGLAPDGGLVVPEYIPNIDENTLSFWSDLSYCDLAVEIFKLFIDDIPECDLRKLVKRVYNKEKFRNDEITPLRFLDDKTAILGLSNGPTLAFKDIAMQMIGEFFEYILVKNNKKLNIVGATSGDTGSAAEHAMIGKSNINVFMLSPHGRMSPFQQSQMYGINEKNIFNIAIKGVFDDCQDIVKLINTDKSFKDKYKIGAVNSINWARILAQTVYYFKGYFSAKKTYPNKDISFSVPSGNFGNVYAGFVAKKMGLPIKNVIVATNENNVLEEFFNRYKYNVRLSKDVYETSSPSMDIGKASNFERYIYNILGDNSDKLSKLWKILEKDNCFDLCDLSASINDSGLISDKSSHANRIETIHNIYKNNNDFIDPHTADGIYVAKKVQDKYKADDLTICLETALPAKFESTIYEAINKKAPRFKGYEDIESIEKNMIIVDNDCQKVKDIIKDKLRN